MKNSILYSAVLLLLPLGPLQAAIPQQEKVNPKVFEILSLPTENRNQVLKKISQDYYKEYLKVAFSEDHSMRLRWRALMLAAESRGEKATADLLKASTHKQWFMRNASLVALAEFNSGEAAKLAKKLLKDKALVVRSAAVEVLQKNPTAEVRDLLWEELAQKYNFRNKESLWIRSQIVEALSQKPVDYEIKMFAKLINDPDIRVQSAAVTGMEKLTGVKLGESKTPRKNLVLMWQDYVRKEKTQL